ncbi:MAG: hypothetical protein BAA01_14730 [Bacillus thermozeamaize]|uniref:Spore cortex biosynthesis protein YabQ n=1 Tax=Bacillus thermozeamaize TaxID=230954 RepID=A0A1Y3PGJ5_9BACI|nr:MAG: hypothetical protein BAA01_14730 [Bacillus thermozeamaize]
MTLSEQWLTFFGMGLCGCLMGVFYDSLREMRRQWGMSSRWLPLFDGLFWVVSLLLVVSFLQLVNNGIFRWHVFLGLIAGVWMYFTLFTRPVRYCLGRLYRLIAWLVLGLIRLVRQLVVRPFLIIGKGLARAGHQFFFLAAGILSGIANVFKGKRRP